MGIIEVIKTHRALGHKAFMEKFKEGVQGVTPLAQAKIAQNSTWITVLGVLCGIGVALWNWKTMWWVFLILLGGLGITAVQLIGGAQKVKLLKDIENITNDFGAIAKEEVTNE